MPHPQPVHASPPQPVHALPPKSFLGRRLQFRTSKVSEKN